MSFNSSWSQFLYLRGEDTIQLKISQVPTQDFSREDICLFNCASSALQKYTIKKTVNRCLYTLEKRFLILKLDWRQLFFNGWFPISFKAQFYLLELELHKSFLSISYSKLYLHIVVKFIPTTLESSNSLQNKP